MRHLFFFFHIIAFLAGFTCAGFAVFVYKIKKDVRIKYFSFVISAFMLILLEQTVTSYTFANSICNSRVTLITGLISALGCGLMIYFLPVLSESFTEEKSVSRVNRIAVVFTSIFAAAVIFYYILPPVKLVSNLLGNFTLIAAIVYSLTGFVKYVRLSREKAKSKIIMNIFILTLLFLPYLILDMKIEKLPVIGQYFPYGIFSVPLYLFSLSIMSIYYGYREFKSLLLQEVYKADTGKMQEVDSIRHTEAASGNTSEDDENKTEIIRNDIIETSENFYVTYNITKREREIIELLIKGCSYNRISEELIVALPTVKSHVYNIYQKTGVKSKIELLNLMKSEKSY